MNERSVDGEKSNTRVCSPIVCEHEMSRVASKATAVSAVVVLLGPTTEHSSRVRMQVEDDRAGVGAVDSDALVVRAADDELTVALQCADEVCGVSLTATRGRTAVPVDVRHSLASVDRVEDRRSLMRLDVLATPRLAGRRDRQATFARRLRKLATPPTRQCAPCRRCGLSHRTSPRPCASRRGTASRCHACRVSQCRRYSAH